MSDPILFHWADYVVFTISICLSIGVGIYYGFFGKKQKTTTEYLLADRNMKIIPVSFSVFLSWFSAIAFLGDPVEVYYHGAIHWIIGIGYVLGCIPIAMYFAPVFHKLSVVSCYEYLETRYNKTFRITLSVVSALLWLPYLGVVLFAPSLALSQVTGWNVTATIVIMGLIITFYSTLGGMKAVVWTDTIQFCILAVGYLAMLIGGIVEVGGLGEVWRRAEQGGRINFNNFNPSPLERSTVWTYLIGGFFRVLTPYMSTQPFIQRYCTLPKPRSAALTVWWNVPMYAIVISLFVITGLVLFAYFGECDPLESGLVDQADQMVPLMVMEVLGFLYGIPGLFMAGIFSASMSSLSSATNALSATFLKDVVEPIYSKCSEGRPMPDSIGTVAAKIVCAILGITVIVLAVVVTYAESTLFQITIAVSGLVMGPQGGIFFLALLVQYVDALGAALGFIVGLLVPLWFGVGAAITGVSYESLPIYMFGCPSENTTSMAPCTPLMTTLFGFTTEETTSGFHVSDLYYWSPLLYGCLGFLTTVFVGMIVGGVSYGVSKFRRGNYALDAETVSTDKESFMEPESDVKKPPLDADNVTSSATDKNENVELKTVVSFSDNIKSERDGHLHCKEAHSCSNDTSIHI